MNNHKLNLFLEEEEVEPTRLTNATGVLPSQEIERLIACGHIAAETPITDAQVQPASIDLRLGDVAYRVRASFLPGPKSSVAKKVEELRLYEIDLSQPSVLERGCVYIVPLMEELNLLSGVEGRANPKSTTGRLDVFARLITDGGSGFDRVPKGYKGKLYVEIVPRTFSILVRQGARVNQLRFLKGNPVSSDKSLNTLNQEKSLVYLNEELPGIANIRQGLRLSIDLNGESGEIVGYRAKHHTDLIDLSRVNFYDPFEFWEPIHAPKTGTIVLNPGEFYILASKEKIRVPSSLAAELMPYDPAFGEFRVHYAGFFDPGFGYGNGEITGTRAVLEVRSHEVPFLLEDGQIVGRLIYERLLAEPKKVYGASILSSYQCQGLALSKQFKLPSF